MGKCLVNTLYDEYRRSGSEGCWQLVESREEANEEMVIRKTKKKRKEKKKLLSCQGDLHIMYLGSQVNKLKFVSCRIPSPSYLKASRNIGVDMPMSQSFSNSA